MKGEVADSGCEIGCRPRKVIFAPMLASKYPYYPFDLFLMLLLLMYYSTSSHIYCLQPFCGFVWCVNSSNAHQEGLDICRFFWNILDSSATAAIICKYYEKQLQAHWQHFLFVELTPLKIDNHTFENKRLVCNLQRCVFEGYVFAD